MFFSEIKIDCENYANKTTPYLHLQSSNRESGWNIGKNAEKLFQWFYNNFLKTDPVKCHFLTNNLE